MTHTSQKQNVRVEENTMEMLRRCTVLDSTDAGNFEHSRLCEALIGSELSPTFGTMELRASDALWMV